MNWLVNLYIKIKKHLYSILINISLSLSKFENDFLKNTKDDDKYTGGRTSIDNIKNQTLKSLQKGEYNQEYVNKFYKILKAADEIANNKNMLKTKLETYGMDSGNEELINYLSNDVNYRNIDITKKTDTSDKYTLLDIIKNNVHILNPEDVLFGNELKKLTTIKSTDLNREIKIEEYTEYLHIKKYLKNKYLLEFYVNSSNNVDEKNIKKLNNIYYSDKYGDKSDYKIIRFYKKTTHNSYNVYKFVATKT
jgi:hypothetical protein